MDLVNPTPRRPAGFYPDPLDTERARLYLGAGVWSLGGPDSTLPLHDSEAAAKMVTSMRRVPYVLAACGLVPSGLVILALAQGAPMSTAMVGMFILSAVLFVVLYALGVWFRRSYTELVAAYSANPVDTINTSTALMNNKVSVLRFLLILFVLPSATALVVITVLAGLLG